MHLSKGLASGQLYLLLGWWLQVPVPATMRWEALWGNGQLHGAESGPLDRPAFFPLKATIWNGSAGTGSRYLQAVPRTMGKTSSGGSFRYPEAFPCFHRCVGHLNPVE